MQTMRLLYIPLLIAALFLIAFLGFLVFRESRSRRSLIWILAASPLVFVGAICLVLTITANRENEPAAPPSVPPAAGAPEAGPAERDGPAPPVPQEIPIQGRIIDADFQAVTGVEAVCGDEKAVSGNDGSFAFPAARRPWKSPLIFRAGEKEILRWESIVTGPAEPGGSLDAAPMGSGPIRWTLNLGRGLPWGGVEKPTPQCFVQVKGVLAEERGSSGEVRVEGITILPDGTHIDCALYFDEHRVASSLERPEVRGGAFRGTIPFPEDHRIQPGRYDLHLVFGVSLEDPADVERWSLERPDIPWGEGLEYKEVRNVFLGDPGEAQEEDRKVEAYFRETIEAVERIQKVLLARSQRAKALARNWDPEIRQAVRDLEKDSLAGNFLDASGAFDFAAWRKFLDEGMRPEISRLLDRHLGRRAVRYRSAEFLLEQVLKRLSLLTKIESILVYQAWGAEIDRNDFYHDEEGAGDESIILQILQKDLAVLRKYRDLTVVREPEPPQGEGQSSR